MKEKIIFIGIVTLIIYAVSFVTGHYALSNRANRDEPLQWAMDTGIMTDGTRWHDAITREELAIALFRFSNLKK